MRSFRRAAYLIPAATVLAVSVPGVGPAPGQEQPHPLAALVKASVEDPTRPFTLLVRFQAKDGAGQQLEAAFASAILPTRREKGCLAYDLNRDPKVPTRYLVYERWQDLASLEAHLKSAHITTLLKEVSELRTAPPEAQVLLPAGD